MLLGVKVKSWDKNLIENVALLSVFSSQNLKDQILTTNVWLEHVSQFMFPHQSGTVINEFN